MEICMNLQKNLMKISVWNNKSWNEQKLRKISAQKFHKNRQKQMCTYEPGNTYSVIRVTQLFIAASQAPPVTA